MSKPTTVTETKTPSANQIENKRVPELRFGEFDGHFKFHLFEDVFIFSTGKNIKQKEAAPEFEIPCVRYGELYHMYGEVIDDVINKTNLDKTELLFSNGDEILLPSAGEDPLDIGSASALTLKNIAIGRTINILRPQQENIYSQIFVSYYINEKLRKKISTLARGASISNVYNSDLKKLKINLPSLPEQQKIATFLSSVDKKIQQLTKKKAVLEDYKKGVMQQLFSGQLRFKDKDGNAYPDWEEKRLGAICEMTSSKRVYLSDYVQEGIPFYRGKEISALRLNKNPIDILYISEERYNEYKSKYGVPEENDILVTAVGTLGNILRIRNNEPFYFKDGNLIWFRKIKESSSFVEILLQWNTRELLKTSIGSTQKALTMVELRKLKFDFPSLQEQQKIATYLSSIDKKIDAVTNKITQTQTFKKGLLQQMFV